jgi:glycosyltransferase involved in cell wall biosynthesis
LMNTTDGTTPPVIGFAGELREKKGLSPLLSAYAQIKRKHPAILLIVGDIRAGEDRQWFEEYKQVHPDMQIIVTGFVPRNDLPAYYSLMDVFVQPSLRDGLPNALLEAMACEKAIVGSAVGGMADAIIDCENGRLVASNHVEELAQAIDEVLMDGELRARLGRNACQTIRNKFTLQAELDANLDVYRRLGLKV